MPQDCKLGKVAEFDPIAPITPQIVTHQGEIKRLEQISLVESGLAPIEAEVRIRNWAISLYLRE